ncbi:uncharacterized protein [Nicotiana tomentosiformis]|uniref:uncharacterized protein n=1 Tax=Nicotiana tomentosiformis TaxID=4098 RepID=UPI00388C8E8F
MRQISQALNSLCKGVLPSDTVVNPKDGNNTGHAMVVITRSGRGGNVPTSNEKQLINDDQMIQEEGIPQNDVQVQNDVQIDIDDSMEETREEVNPSREHIINMPDTVVQKAKVTLKKTPPSYPQRFTKQNGENQFKKFIHMMKGLSINVPLVEALGQMPYYAKFMKELVTKNRSMNFETIKVTHQVSAIVHSMATKLEDLGAFIISCTIRSADFAKALCDLGESINLMPYSMFKTNGIGEPRPTSMRPCFSTGKALFDVEAGELTFRVIDDEQVTTKNSLVSLVGGKEGLLDEETPLLEAGLISVAPNIAQIRGVTQTPTARAPEQQVHIGQVPGIVPVHRVIPVQPELSGAAYRWWQAYEEGRPADATPPTWAQFSKMFLKEFVPQTLQDACCIEFERLCQGTMTVSEYAIRKTNHTKPSIEEPPTLELKPLPSHLRNAFPVPCSTLPVILSSCLTNVHVDSILVFLQRRNKDIGWTLVDIWGISPTFCMHKIKLEDGAKPSIEHQTRFNEAMQEMPFGLCNALMTFQRYVMDIFTDMVEDYLEVFMDDFSVFGDLFDDCLANLDKDAKFHFSDDCMRAFEQLKLNLTTTPIITSPNWSLTFELICDASDVAVEAVLGRRINKVFHPIYYVGKTMNNALVIYIVIEKEILSIVFAIEKFRPYLMGAKVIVHIDHAARRYLMRKKES